MTKREEILEKIAKAEKNQHMSENLRKQYIEGKNRELAALKDETTTEPKKEEKQPAKKEAPKLKKERKKKQAQPKVTKTVIFQGKEIHEGDANYCKALVAKWDERREKAKASGKKYRTEPVIKKIAGDITDSVIKAVNSVPHSDIKKNPVQFKKEVKHLESAAKEFITAFKDLLGSDYKKGQIDPEFTELETLLNKLIKKYGGHTMEDGGIVTEEPDTEVNNLTEEEERDMESAIKLALDSHHAGIRVSELSRDEFDKQARDKFGDLLNPEDIKLAYNAMKISGYKAGGRLKRRDGHKIRKVAKVMHEFKLGKLKTSDGRKVMKYKQAIAIALSEAGLSRKHTV